MSPRDQAINQWLTGSRKSLRAAKVLHEDGNEELALFHCHLSAEKCLKALYVLEKDAAPPLTHDLGTLASTLEDGAVQRAFEELKVMSKFAVAARYDDIEVLEEEILPPRIEHWLSFCQSLLHHAEQREK